MTATRTTAAPKTRLSVDNSVSGRKAQKRKNPFACLPSTDDTKSSDENTEMRDSTADAEAQLNHAEATNYLIDFLVWCFLWCENTDVSRILMSTVALL